MNGSAQEEEDDAKEEDEEEDENEVELGDESDEDVSIRLFYTTLPNSMYDKVEIIIENTPRSLDFR